MSFISIIPNPATSGIYTVSGYGSNSILTINNLLGEVVYQSAVSNQQSAIDISLNLKASTL